ncbi:MAG: hypothetical protein JXQ90_11955 [Cyclobacteriaceae bacterium]
MRRLVLLTLGWISAYAIYAQIHNTGLPITIQSGALLSGGDITSSGKVSLSGRLLSTGDVNLTSVDGPGTIALIGSDQQLFLRDTIGTLYIEGGIKKVSTGLVVADGLTFSSGKIEALGDLVLLSGSDVTGHGDDSYVIGRLIRQGDNGLLLFPIGSSTSYTPVSLSTVNSGASLQLQYFAQSTDAFAGWGLLGVSPKQYWDLQVISGTFDGSQVTLPILDESFTSQDQMVVAYAADDFHFKSAGADEVMGSLAKGSIKSQETVNSGRLVVGRYFDEQLRVNDSLALVKMYDEMGGLRWHRKEGWKTEALNDWHGLGLVDKRVSSIDLSSNRLQNVFPSMTAGLERVVQMDLSDNQLVNFQENLQMMELTALDVSMNRLQFGPLEKLINQVPSLRYADQQMALEEEIALVEIGSNYTLDRTISGSNNTYNWEKQDAEFDGSGELVVLDIEGFDAEGNYMAIVSNSLLPDLTISTAPILLRVSSLRRDSLSLVALYDGLLGDNWANNAGWKTGPLSNWEGVEINNNRVTSIDLAANNLRGVVPVDINFIADLSSIDLEENAITDVPVMTSLSKLNHLDVSGNQLDFGDLEPNALIDGLVYNDQGKIGEYELTKINRGSDHLVSMTTPGDNNTYQWYLNDEAIASANDEDFLIRKIGYSNMGRYSVQIANTLLPGLILESEDQEVLALAEINFTPTYQDIDNVSAVLDEGEAYLFKINAPGVPYDSAGSMLIADNGINFKDVVLDNYLMFVRTDTLLLKEKNGITDSVKLLPTYYSNTIDWAEADTLFLRDFIDDTLKMQQQPKLLTERDGDGQIGLVVESLLDEEVTNGRIESRRRVKKAGCSLRRRTTGGGGRLDEEEWELVAYKETDDNGEVNFGNLPDGFYRLNIQYPGVPMDPNSFVEFEISDEEEGDGYELAATISTDGIVVEVVEELGIYRNYFKNLSVYPNAADQYLIVAYDRLNAGSVQVRLLNLEGKEVLNQKLSKGDRQELRLDVTDIVGGIYLLYFYDPTKEDTTISTVKVIIRH